MVRAPKQDVVGAKHFWMCNLSTGFRPTRVWNLTLRCGHDVVVRAETGRADVRPPPTTRSCQKCLDAEATLF